MPFTLTAIEYPADFDGGSRPPVAVFRFGDGFDMRQSLRPGLDLEQAVAVAAEDAAADFHVWAQAAQYFAAAARAGALRTPPPNP